MQQVFLGKSTFFSFVQLTCAVRTGRTPVRSWLALALHALLTENRQVIQPNTRPFTVTSVVHPAAEPLGSAQHCPDHKTHMQENAWSDS